MNVPARTVESQVQATLDELPEVEAAEEEAPEDEAVELDVELDEVELNPGGPDALEPDSGLGGTDVGVEPASEESDPLRPPVAPSAAESRLEPEPGVRPC